MPNLKLVKPISGYRRLIVEAIAGTEQKDVDPALVEETMRCTFKTLDHLPKPEFNRAARAAALALHLDPEFAKEMAGGAS